MRLGTNIVLLLLVFLPTTLFAQKQDNIWYFGGYAGLDFNGGAPVALTDGKLHTLEGCASVADRNTGKLLFYTDGDTVWNRDHVMMLNGYDLYGHWSSTQSALIVPMPNDTTRYYIFTADALGRSAVVGRPGSNGINYSIVNMTLDGGRGGVEVKNIRLFAPSTEKLVAVGTCRGSYWVITHGTGDTYYAFEVTRTGVSLTPVVSHVGLDVGAWSLPEGWFSAGYLKVSPNGSKLAAAMASAGIVELYDFNSETGDISNAVRIGMGYRLEPYGISFSPDNLKLYVATRTYIPYDTYTGRLFQFDATQRDSASMAASRVLVDTLPVAIHALQLAPDGKIYVAELNNKLGVIEKPNALGISCTFRPDAIDLGSATCGLGLPNIIDAKGFTGNGFNAHVGPDVTICRGETATLTASANSDATYEWSPATMLQCSTCATTTARPDTTTTFIVRITSKAGCSITDTLVVTVLPAPHLSTAGNTTICHGGDSIKLMVSGADQFNWSPTIGLSCSDCQAPIAAPDSTTIYTVIGRNANGCSDTAHIKVTVFDVPMADAGQDATICFGDSITLHASGKGSYLWSPSDGLSCTDCSDPITKPQMTTTYQLRVTNAVGCSAVDSVTVSVLPRPIADAGRDTAICAGTSVQLHASGGTRYHWSPAVGLSCIDCADPIASPTATTTYSVIATNENNCTATDSVTVTVIDAASVDAGPSQTICFGDSVRLTASDGASWKWSPSTGLSCIDCRDPMASPLSTTLYTVTVSGAGGCQGSDTVTVTVLPKPTVNAGEDVSICSGTNTRLHASGALSYHWSPSDGLSCSDCAAPIASPSTTTSYRVTGTTADGCTAGDEVVVAITDAQSIHAHIDRSYRALPGTLLTVPVMLDDAITDAVDTVTFALTYNGGILRLQKIETQGMLLDEWQEEVIADTIGGEALRFIATGDNHLPGRGALLALQVQAFLGDTTASELPFTLSLGEQPCLRIATLPGRIALDSICGLSLRLIEPSMSKYVLKQNDPNPFNPTTTIEFSLGLDGSTRLEVLNAAGKRVALLVDEYMQPGRYQVMWDASTMPSGLYYCRLTSGAWSAIGRMVLVK